jgi:hypothetical protein
MIKPTNIDDGGYMSREEYSGTVDGKPAKFVHYPERKQTQVYWGGYEKPDGKNHNHMTIQDINTHTAHFIRENGRVIVDHSYGSGKPEKRQIERKRDAAEAIGGMVVDSWRRALRHWRRR